MTDDELHHQLTPHAVGILVSASTFIHLLDKPGMTIAELRASLPAITFRNHVTSFRRWMVGAIRNAPEKRFPPEVKRALEEWFGENERAEAVGSREREGLNIED